MNKILIHVLILTQGAALLGSDQQPLPFVNENSLFNTQQPIQQNREDSTSKKIKVCEKCGKSFTTNYNLMVHSRTHTNERPFKCDQCEKSFNSKSDLKKHTRTHTGEKPYTCETCNIHFSQKGNLKNHIHSLTHMEKVSSLQNQESTLPLQPLLQSSDDATVQNSEKIKSCKKCGKSFTTNYNLMVHSRTHTNERPFKCDRCNKSFKNKQHLIVHSRCMHTNEKPYKCATCNVSFAQLSSLTFHIRTLTHMEKVSSLQNQESTLSQQSLLQPANATVQNSENLIIDALSEKLLDKFNVANEIEENMVTNKQPSFTQNFNFGPMPNLTIDLLETND